MSNSEHPVLLRFESFELDLRTRELRKEGRLVKLQDLPVKLLALLAGRPGELVTREEIEKALWGDEQFVDFEHSINTAMRKIREALGDELEKPRFIETLPRKGYRFIAPVEAITHTGEKATATTAERAQDFQDPKESEGATVAAQESAPLAMAPRAPAGEDFFLPRARARGLFLAIQVGYLAIYCSALYQAEALEQALDRVLMTPARLAIPLVLVSAMCGIAVRLYLLTSVGLDHPAAGAKFRRLFPALFVLDAFWAASPLLLTRKLGYGLALAAVAALAYLPFAQRTLIQSIYRGISSTRSTG